MNYETRSWHDRFGHLSIEGEGDEGGGGGGGEPATATDDGGGDSGQDDSPGIDLNSVDPEVIQQFPKGHILSREQLKALTGYNPKAKPKPTDPTVEAKEPVAKAPVKKAPAAAPATAGLKPGQKKAGEPYYDAGVKRWRDGKSNKIIPAPKGAVPPVTAAAAPKQPAGDFSSPAAIAAAAAAAATRAVQGAQPPAAPAEAGGGSEEKRWFGDITAPMVIPDETAQNLFSDDAAASVGAVNQLVNGLGNTIMREMVQVMAHMRTEILSQIPAAVSAIGSHQKNSDGFYGRYPMLNNPILHSAVDKVGAAVSKQFDANGVAWRHPNGQYTEDFMDSVASAFSEATGVPISATVAETAVHPVAPVQKKDKPFFNRGPQARAAEASREQMKSADIMSVIRGGRG